MALELKCNIGKCTLEAWTEIKLAKNAAYVLEIAK